jgi:type VI secretion system secreted protein Hcp
MEAHMSAYIKFDGIDGEVSEKGHDKWVEIQMASWAVDKAIQSGVTGSQRRRGDTRVHDITISKVVDKSSPKLFEAVANGKVFKKVQIEFTATYTDAGQVTYLALELENVHVASCSVSWSEGASSESCVLNYTKIKYTYTENDEKGGKKGNVETTWDTDKAQK